MRQKQRNHVCQQSLRLAFAAGRGIPVLSTIVLPTPILPTLKSQVCPVSPTLDFFAFVFVKLDSGMTRRDMPYFKWLRRLNLLLFYLVL